MFRRTMLKVVVPSHFLMLNALHARPIRPFICSHLVERVWKVATPAPLPEVLLTKACRFERSTVVVESGLYQTKRQILILKGCNIWDLREDISYWSFVLQAADIEEETEKADRGKTCFPAFLLGCTWAEHYTKGIHSLVSMLNSPPSLKQWFWFWCFARVVWVSWSIRESSSQSHSFFRRG